MYCIEYISTSRGIGGKRRAMFPPTNWKAMNRGIQFHIESHSSLPLLRDRLKALHLDFATLLHLLKKFTRYLPIWGKELKKFFTWECLRILIIFISYWLPFNFQVAPYYFFTSRLWLCVWLMNFVDGVAINRHGWEKTYKSNWRVNLQHYQFLFKFDENW